MAVLQKIRERSVLLLVVIGFSLLAFIVGDFLMSGTSLTTNSVGSINGESIPTQEYMTKVQRLEQSRQASGGQAYEMVWNEEIREKLLQEQFDKAGLRLGKDQIINVIKTHPNFANNPEFLNDAGQFDTGKFNNFLNQLKQDNDSWRGWLEYEASLEDFAKEQTYYNMIKGTVYTTGLEGKYAYKKETDRTTFDYVTVSYNTIRDEDVQVTDSDISAYIQVNKKQFKSPDYRSVEYVFIPSKPSKEDENAVKTEIESLLQSSVVFNSETQTNDTLPGFGQTKDVISFVNANSNVPYEDVFYTKEQLPAEYQEQLFNLNKEEVFGPYLLNDHYCLTRLTDKQSQPKTVDASHILIAYQGAMNAAPTIALSKEEAQNKADELLTQLQSGASFAKLAEENTDDPGSKETGGKYENIQKGQMVPEFDEYIFSNPTGKIGVVETQFGFHVLKVDSQSEEKIERIQLATVAKAVEPSSTTQDQLYTEAAKFEMEATNNTDFSKVATDMGLIAHPATAITAFGDRLPAIEGSHTDAINWAYNRGTSVGDVRRFDNAEGYLIVKLTEVNESGLLGVNDAREEVEPIVRNQKKAALIKQQMTGSTLEEIAQNSKSKVQSGETNGATQTIGFVKEPLVTGYAFGTASGEVSELIEGNNGVYVVRTKEVVTAPELPNYNAYKSKIQGSNANTVQNGVFSAIYNKATIKDNRAKVLR